MRAVYEQLTKKTGVPARQAGEGTVRTNPLAGLPSGKERFAAISRWSRRAAHHRTTYTHHSSSWKDDSNGGTASWAQHSSASTGSFL